MNWYPHACPVCRGDLYEDSEDQATYCLMCGREYALLPTAFGRVVSLGGRREETMPLVKGTKLIGRRSRRPAARIAA
jgi:hypothetical protein